MTLTKSLGGRLLLVGIILTVWHLITRTLYALGLYAIVKEPFLIPGGTWLGYTTDVGQIILTHIATVAYAGGVAIVLIIAIIVGYLLYASFGEVICWIATGVWMPFGHWGDYSPASVFRQARATAAMRRGEEQAQPEYSGTGVST